MKTQSTEKSRVSNKKARKFHSRLNNFCERYSQSAELPEAVTNIVGFYQDDKLLNPGLNVEAAKCWFDEEHPRDLIRAIDTLFKNKGAHLMDASAATDIALLRAILWIGRNIEEHIDAVKALIALEECDG